MDKHQLYCSIAPTLENCQQIGCRQPSGAQQGRNTEQMQLKRGCADGRRWTHAVCGTADRPSTSMRWGAHLPDSGAASAGGRRSRSWRAVPSLGAVPRLCIGSACSKRAELSQRMSGGWQNERETTRRAGHEDTGGVCLQSHES